MIYDDLPFSIHDKKAFIECGLYGYWAKLTESDWSQSIL